MSRYGQFRVAEPLHNLALIHRHRDEELKTVDHEPPCPVLDQQTLVAQGITVARFVPGARAGTNALGSCTANAATAHLSGVVDAGTFDRFVYQMSGGHGAPSTEAVQVEEAAIGFYHFETDQTGTTSTEWPPTDCGSSGPYIFDAMERLGFVHSQRIAHGPQDLVSLLQGGSVIEGTPFFFEWETPDANGFVDGNGTRTDLERAIASGVAGGHETCITAVERIAIKPTGTVIPEATVLRVRNSWGRAWGDDGSFRIHLSTLAMLGSYCDFRQFLAL